jgi:biopolymer transport protein TolR
VTSGRWRRGGGRGDLPMNAEINVTSLIDVAFTLLVIFIITAPMLQGGLEVRLPQAQVQPLTAQDQAFIVTVDQDGSIFVGETEVTFEEFESAFPQIYRAASPQAVYVKGDEAALYGVMLPVMAIISRVVQEDGIPMGLIAEPERRR